MRARLRRFAWGGGSTVFAVGVVVVLGGGVVVVVGGGGGGGRLAWGLAGTGALVVRRAARREAGALWFLTVAGAV
jgi:hypothetical protein